MPLQIGDHCVVVGGKYGGRQGVLTKLTPMKARLRFDGEESSHLVDQSNIRQGFGSAAGKVGDRVAIVKGKYVGLHGCIQRFTLEMVYVLLDSDGSCPRVSQSSVVCIQSPKINTFPLPWATTNRSVPSNLNKSRPSAPAPSTRSSYRSPTHRIRTVSPTPSCDDNYSDVAGRYDVKICVRYREKPRSSRKPPPPRVVLITVEY